MFLEVHGFTQVLSLAVMKREGAGSQGEVKGGSQKRMSQASGRHSWTDGNPLGLYRRQDPLTFHQNPPSFFYKTVKHRGLG